MKTKNAATVLSSTKYLLVLIFAVTMLFGVCNMKADAKVWGPQEEGSYASGDLRFNGFDGTNSFTFLDSDNSTAYFSVEPYFSVWDSVSEDWMDTFDYSRLSYQWYKDGQLLSGENNYYLDISYPDGAGSYKAVVSISGEADYPLEFPFVAVVLGKSSDTALMTSSGQSFKTGVLYSFTPTEDGIYTLFSDDEEAASSKNDPSLVIYDTDGQYLLSDDDGGEGYNFRAHVRLSAGKKYYLFNKWPRSDTVITIKKGIEGPSLSARKADQTVVTGEYYALTVDESDEYTIFSNDPAGKNPASGSPDPWRIRLYDMNKDSLVESDNISSSDLNCSVTYYLKKNEIYYVRKPYDNYGSNDDDCKISILLSEEAAAKKAATEKAIGDAKKEAENAKQEVAAAKQEVAAAKQDVATAKKEAEAAKTASGADSAAAQAALEAQKKAEAELKAAKEKLAKAEAKVKKLTPPKKVTLKKPKAQKNAIKVSWKKIKDIKNYELQYSLKSNFKGAKTVTVKKTKTSYTIKKLTANKKYYIRIRGVKTVDKSTIYGPWSAKKNSKPKK